jgi:hypothetical protein
MNDYVLTSDEELMFLKLDREKVVRWILFIINCKRRPSNAANMITKALNAMDEIDKKIKLLS